MRTKMLLLIAATGGLILGAGAVAYADNQATGTGNRAQIEQLVHDYILNHPEIIPEAMKRLQSNQTAQMIASQRTALETPFAGAWAGAAQGDVTLVMFTDYSCGYCRASVPDIDRLLAEDKHLKIVWREIPILGQGSKDAAWAALGAANQGRYLDFHRRMFAAGVPNGTRIARVQSDAGVKPVTDPSGAIARELDNNIALARSLELTGTPSFVIGNKLIQGAVGYDELKQAIAAARAAS